MSTEQSVFLAQLFTAYQERVREAERVFHAFHEILFSQYSAEAVNFFGLIAALKKIDGFYIQSLLKQDSTVLHGIVRDICKADPKINVDPLYVFDEAEQLIRLNPKRIASNVYDANKTITFSELLKMSDLEFLFTLNGYDLPFCNCTSTRSIYEQFFSAFLKKIKATCANSDSPEAVRFRFLEDSGIPGLAVTLESCLSMYYHSTEIVKNFNTAYRQAFSNAQASAHAFTQRLPDEQDFPLNEVIKFFHAFVFYKGLYIGIEEKKSKNIALLEGDHHNQQLLDECEAEFKDFLRVNFLKTTHLVNHEIKEWTEKTIGTELVRKLSDIIAGALLPGTDINIEFFKGYSEKYPDFVAACIHFIEKLKGFLIFLSDSEGNFQKAIMAGQNLLEACENLKLKLDRPVTTPRGNSPVASSPRTPVISPAPSPRPGSGTSSRVNSPRVLASPRPGSGTSSRVGSPRAQLVAKGEGSPTHTPRSPGAEGKERTSGVGSGSEEAIAAPRPRRLDGSFFPSGEQLGRNIFRKSGGVSATLAAAVAGLSGDPNAAGPSSPKNK